MYTVPKTTKPKHCPGKRHAVFPLYFYTTHYIILILYTSPITLQKKQIHLTSSLAIKYLNTKLCGIHSTMLFLDLPELSFFTLFFIVSGRHSWIISINAAWLNPESLLKDSMIFGKTSFWSFFTPKVARTYSSFAVSSSWYIPLGV